MKSKMTDERITQAQKLRNEGITYQEIGDTVGVSLETVRRHLNPIVKQHDSEYSSSHKKERARYAARWYVDHKEEVLQYQDQYRIDHKEKIRQDGAKYNADHKVKRAQYHAEYYINHAEEKQRYRQGHLPERAAYQAKRRALKVGALIGATANQLNEIAEVYRRAKEASKVRCYLCGKLIPLGHRHVDHITPLSKGGQHRPSNLAVACDTCNAHKHDKIPEKVGVLI